MQGIEHAVGLHTPEISSFALHNIDNIIANFTNSNNNGTFSSYEISSTQLLFLKAMIAALTSGLGGIPLFIIGELPNHVMGFCIIFAAGLMTGCSVVLFMEALQFMPFIYVLGYAILGMLLIHGISYLITDFENLEFAGLKGTSANQALLIVLSMGLHSLGEGISVGVSANSENSSIGLLVIVSLAIHNIPEGIAISLLLMSRGMNVWQASLFSIISNLPQPLMAIPSHLFISYFQQLLPLGFGIASGAMTYIVCTELIPESKEKLSKYYLISTFATSLGIILAIAFCAR